MSRTLAIALVGTATLLGGGAAWAQAGATCSVGIPAINFGSYDTLAPVAALPVTGLVSVECALAPAGRPQRVDYQIRLGKGASGTYTPRRMRRAGATADTLEYNLYLESLGAIWGDGTNGTAVAGGTVMVTPGRPTRSRDHRLLGQIPPRQPVAAGAYQDTIIVTVTFN